MKKRILVLAAIVFCNQLPAQDDSTSRSLEEITLTSNKYPRKLSETGKVVHVISKEWIERSGGKTLNELLNTLPGTTIVGANNNPGTNQTVSLRGASAGNTLILIDGIPVNDPSVISNYFDLNFIDIDQVERIEVLKGGQSTLYGSDAVAGVINIITKKTTARKIQANVILEGGSYNTFKQVVGLSGTLGLSNYSIQYTHLDSKGFSAAHDSTGSAGYDNDAYNQHLISANIGFKLSPKLALSFNGKLSHYKAELDASAFTDDRDFTVKNKNQQAGMGLSYTYRNGETRFNYHFNRADRRYADDSLHRGNAFAYYTNSHYIGKTHYAELYNNFKWKEFEFLAGIDFRENSTEQDYFTVSIFGPYSTPHLDAEMNQVSAYASSVFHHKNIMLEAGGRLNKHSEYGNHFTFNFNPAIDFNDKIRLYSNLYSSFKTPTLYQLFDPFAGNPGLEPERAVSFEAGISSTRKDPFEYRVTGFYNKTKDVILYTFDPSTFQSRYINGSEQVTHGAEVELGYQIGSFAFRSNYTYTNGETTSLYDGTGSPLVKDTTYYNLYRIPKHAFNLSASWKASEKFFFSAATRILSKREEFVYGDHPLPLDGYATIDLYGEYKAGSKLKFYIDLRNITDSEYFDILGYNARNFNFNFGARVGF